MNNDNDNGDDLSLFPQVDCTKCINNNDIRCEECTWRHIKKSVHFIQCKTICSLCERGMVCKFENDNDWNYVKKDAEINVTEHIVLCKDTTNCVPVSPTDTIKHVFLINEGDDEIK